MHIAIVYQSMTGNTRLVAEAIRSALDSDCVIYCGPPQDVPQAELYFVGSWTDKGSCCKEIGEFLSGLENKSVAWFGTAGFGGSPDYYDALFSRVSALIPDSNRLLGHFYCQGKMPMSVRDRYVSLLTEHPDDKKLQVSVQNFDQALSHPDEEDLEQARQWARAMVR